MGDARAAGSELSEEPIPMATEEDLPARTPPIIEIGPEFLGVGNLDEGIELPTGAVWQPALWVFGEARTALQYFDGGQGTEAAEWANEVDLFANLRLSGTERVLLGISPISLDGGSKFTGYIDEPDSEEGWYDRTNGIIRTLFFEGEFGEIFPELDPDDSLGLDFGFSVGRQPLFFQEGMMINDTIDSVGLTRDTIIIPGVSVDIRSTAIFGWDEVNRDDNREDRDAYLFGLFNEGDIGGSTVQLDFAYVDGGEPGDDEDGVYVGAASIQRIPVFGQTLNTAFRANASISTGEDSAEVSDGALLFTEISMTPHGTDNVAYVDAFWGIDEFSSAARDEATGGPLGRTGILFAAVGLGNYGSALSNQAKDVVGAALGYQMFFNNERTQLIFEVGGRAGTDSNVDDQAALGARFQQAIGDRYVFRVDGFVSEQENADMGSGVRSEFLVRF